MTRLEILTLKLADGALNDVEACELEALLAAAPAAAVAHMRLLEVEAALRGQRETLDLAAATVVLLGSQLARSVEHGIMRQIEAEPLPAWARAAMIALSRNHPAIRGRFVALFPGRPLVPRLRRPAMAAFAASAVLLLTLGVWFFGPAMGRPLLAEVKGVDVSIQRGTKSLPAAGGMGLQPADVLRLGTNTSAVIAFGTEHTRLELSAGVELKLTSLKRGKRFVLRAGRMEASVARQRPFQPMIITTPQAEARVLGTKFSLLTADNATRLDVTQGKVRFTRATDGKAVQVGAGNFAVAASNYALAAQPLPGKVLREVWLDLPGDTVQDLKYQSRYPNAPSGHDFPPSFETTTNWPSAFGTRMRAFLLPTVGGNYEFSFSGNGQIALWLSPDDAPADKVKIGQIAFTRNRPGDPPPEKTRSRLESGPIPLEAGRRYYMEALHKYGTVEDRLSITWKRPDGITEPIPSEFLAPFNASAKEKKR